VPSFLNGVVEAAAAGLPATARSYSGAVGADTWSWRSTPFVGASDHLLVVEPPTGRPAVSLGHWPDRFNHSSADTPDKVDPAELRRTATVAGGAVTAIRSAADGDPAAVLDATLDWATARLVAAPSAAAMAHRAAVGVASVRSVAALAPDAGAEAERAATWLTDLAGTLARRPARADPPAPPARPRAPRDGVAYRRGWAGPFNLREVGAGLAELMAEDRGGNYARIVALARALDGRRDREAVRVHAELTAELSIPHRTADTVLDVLARAGWAVPADREVAP